MLLPNKLFSYNESILSKFPIVIKTLKKEPISVGKLYLQINQKLSSVSEYIELLDCLYALNKIEYDEDKEVLKYVD